MLSILVVTVSGEEGQAIPSRLASIEVLRAHGAEDALEKLGRNRRIDAVLLDAGAQNPEIARAIREDNAAPPPLFEAAGDSLEREIERLIVQLEG